MFLYTDCMKNKNSTVKQYTDLLEAKYRKEGYDSAAMYARVSGHLIGMFDFGLSYMTKEELQSSLNNAVEVLESELAVS